MKATVILPLMGLLANIRCQEGQKGQEGQVYCGRRLSAALALVCENGLVKRDSSLYSIANEVFSWIPAHRARALSRGKRNVVSECCDKPCTISELRAYCAD